MILKEMFKEEIRKNYIQVANNQNKKLNFQKIMNKIIFILQL